MSETNPGPKFARWRWLVFVLLFLACGAFALVPRHSVDPRLVGRWQSASQGMPWPHVVTFEFRDDGVLLEDSGVVGATTSYWWVKGDTIVTGPNPQLSPSTSLGEFRQWINRVWAGSSPPRPPDAFKIITITRDKMTLEYVGVRRWPAPTYKLIRLAQ